MYHLDLSVVLCIFQALQPAACVKHAVKRAPKFMRHNDKNVTLLGVLCFYNSALC